MKDLTEAQVAWLAGIYEGEGSCAITGGRAIRVSITMTDQDVMESIANLTTLGSVRTVPQRNENYKQAYTWSIGSSDAVLFLQAIMPWLGHRRTERAQAAIANWSTNRKQSTASDLECVKGHPYSLPGNKRTKYGTCHLCNLEASRLHRQRKATAALASS